MLFQKAVLRFVYMDTAVRRDYCALGSM
jgi:hypothetical protein